MKKLYLLFILGIFVIGTVYAAGMGVIKREKCKERFIEIEQEVPIIEKITKYRPRFKTIEKFYENNGTRRIEKVLDGEDPYVVEEQTGRSGCLTKVWK